MSDDEIIKRFCGGNADAVSVVSDWVRTAVFRRVWVEGVVPDDIVSETIENLLTIFRSGDLVVQTSLKAFVQSVAKRKAIDAVRKYRRERNFVHGERHRGAPDNPTPLDILETKQKDDLWQQIFKNLDDKCRMIWRKIFYENMHYSTVAAALGMTNGAMRTRLARCKAAAMKILAERE
jgi:RNA polymerase sigma factor (sigma-70 family)